MNDHVPTGIRRLDELLGGGLPQGSLALLHGPPFLGKELLARRFLAEGLREGTPGVAVATGLGASDLRRHLAELEPGVPRGHLEIVDLYSRAIGPPDQDPDSLQVDGPGDLNEVAVALAEAQRRLQSKGLQHRFVLDSLSTLMAYHPAATMFRFLQVFLGRARRAGATGLVLLDRGMHPDADVQMVKHLLDGVLEVKQDQGKTLLRTEGLGLTEDRGWVEYKLHERTLELVGSFAAGRIR